MLPRGVKEVKVVMTQAEYDKLKSKKGKRTWLDVLNDGINEEAKDSTRRSAQG